MDALDAFKFFVATVAGAIIGGLSSIAVFRARFIVIDRQLAEQARERATERASDKEALATQRAHDKEMLDVTLAYMRKEIARARRASARMEKRQIASLELLADVARKVGVERRQLGVDALAHVMLDSKEMEK